MTLTFHGRGYDATLRVWCSPRVRRNFHHAGVSLLRTFLAASFAGLLAAGCSRPAPAAGPAKAGLRAVSLQTDWVPQAEHGGFYQALARGFYAEAGLAVEIRPGGRGMIVKLAVAKGDADFGLSRSDDVIVFAGHGLPLVMVAATFQHDPQALMVRAESPVHPNGRWYSIRKRREMHLSDFALGPIVYGTAMNLRRS